MNLVDLSIRRPVTIMMFTVAFLLFGSVVFNRMGVNLLPELSYPTLTVRTVYEGSAPAEVENLVSKPIEEVLGTVKNVRTIHSISRAGQSDVIMEFHWGADMSRAGLDVREKLDRLQLPLDIKSPALLRFNPSLAPIIRMSLARKDIDSETNRLSETQLIELRRFAQDELKKQLESVEGVAAVKISGGLEDEIQILVDQNKISRLNLTLDQINQRLRSENVNLSGGRLEDGHQQLLIRTINQFKSISEIEQTIISSKNGKTLRLKEIAEVRQAYKEREAITRVNGVEAVEIAIYKEGDANTVKVAERLEKRFKDTEELLPKHLELTKLYDQSTFISSAISEVIQAGLIGGLLAMLVLYSFLRHFWSTLIISISIPISVIVSFNFMYASQISLNIMSLGGIALAIGLLVDNAVVVLENIARHKEQLGKETKLTPKMIQQAAAKGAKEVIGAITASTLTTIAVFLPLAFVDGIAGQLFNDQALTVTYTLLVSLIVAVTLIPMLSARHAELDTNAQPSQLKPSKPQTKLQKITYPVRILLRLIFIKVPSFVATIMVFLFYGISWVGQKAFSPLAWLVNQKYSVLAKAYRHLLKATVKSPALVVSIGILIFIGSLSLVPNLGMELIPKLSQGEFNVELKATPGTPIESTDKLIESARQLLSNNKLVDRTYSVSGTGNRLDASPEKGGENWGEINVVLKKGTSSEDEEKIILSMRDQLNSIPGLAIKISRPTLFSFDTPLEIEVKGYDLVQLKKSSQMIVESLQSSSRFSDIKSTIESGYPEVRIEFDHQKIAALGFTSPQIAQRIVDQVRGDIATKYSFRDRKIDVLVRTIEPQRNSLESISNLLINTDSDKPVRLSSVANIIVDTAPSEIHRIDQERVAVIRSNIRYGDLNQAALEVRDLLQSLPQAYGIRAEVGGQSEEMEASFSSLYFALALAVFLVYLVMASQFESLLYPFVILFSVPLAMIGAIIALWITKTNVSVVVFIGLILLAGIVVNNAIVLIDKINQLRRDGLDITKAIQEAGESRLRPIIITTLTTILGMLPLALGLGDGGELRAPMAITVIGGLTMSTLLTLLFIPALYRIVSKDTHFTYREDNSLNLGEEHS
jgi:hydrophobic/amphiphilic exporter-1 (mainly G- bacteria), HAE1 family